MLPISGSLFAHVAQSLRLPALTAMSLRGAVRERPRLNVLHIVSGHSLAGVEQYVLQLAEVQRAQGLGVHIVYPRGGWLEGELERRGLPHTALALHGTIDAGSLLRLVAIARRERITVVHGHLARGMFYAMALGKMTGLPSIGTDHMNAPNWVMRHLKRLVIPSRHLQTARWEAIRPGRLAVVPNGVDVERLEDGAAQAAAERAAWGLPEDVPVIGLLGRITKVKGHDTLLRALHLLPETACAVFAGPDDPPWGATVRRMIEDLGLSERVRVIPARSNVGAFLAASDIVAIPSRIESGPLVVLEAMALGRPIVATAVGSIPDVIMDGQNGLLLRPDDPEELAAALARVLSDAAYRARLGAAARADALEHRTTRVMEQALRGVYLEAQGVREASGVGEAPGVGEAGAR